MPKTLLFLLLFVAIVGGFWVAQKLSSTPAPAGIVSLSSDTRPKHQQEKAPSPSPSKTSSEKEEKSPSPQSIKASLFEKPLKKTSYLGRLEKIRQLIQYGYYSLATIEIGKAIKAKPQISEPYFLLAEIYLRTDDVWKLDNLIKKIETQFPNHPKLAVLKVRELINARKFQEALAYLEQRDTPKDLLFYKALLLALQNDHEAAQALLKDIAKIKVSQKDYQVKAGGLTEVLPDPETISPEIAKKASALRTVYTDFKELSDGKNAHLFANIAKALAESEEYFLAHEFADTAIKEALKYVDAWLIKGYALLEMQKLPEAEKALQHAYELDPLRPEIHYLLGLTFYKEQKYPEAALFFEKALEFQQQETPEKEDILWKLVDIYQQLKQYEKALKTYQLLIERFPDPEKMVPAFHLAINVTAKPELALAFGKALTKQYPKDSLALNLLGWALIANKEYEEAKKVLEKALLLDPENPRTYLNLGILYEIKKQFPQAKKMYQKVYEVGAKDPRMASVVNLAVERYNRLVAENQAPQEKPASTRAPNAP